MNQEKKQSKKTILLLVVICLAVVAIILCVVLLLKKKQPASDAAPQAMTEQTAATEQVQTTEIPETEEMTDPEIEALLKMGIEVPEKQLDWDALHEENPDIYAWIVVPGTDIDYPVLQHPTDDAYYVSNDLDGNSDSSGCIYSESRSRKDFSDFHTVLYGQNREDQTMFSTLHNFEAPDSVEGDHYIYVYTEDEILVYKIFAAYEFPAVHLLANFDLTNEYVREQYLKEVFAVDEGDVEVANVRHDVEVTPDDHILTLSTHVSDPDRDAMYRFLVVGVLVYPEEMTSDAG